MEFEKEDEAFKRSLPKLQDATTVKVTESIKSAANDSLQTLFGTNLVLAAFGSFLLQFLWSLINGLQMIVITSLFNSDLPYNSHAVNVQILQLVNFEFEFLSSEQQLERIFDFSDTDAFLDNGEQTPRFSQAGYETSNFIELLGPIFFAILAWLAYLVFIALLRMLCSPCNDNFFTRRLR